MMRFASLWYSSVMRTTISISDPLLETAKERAALRKVTLSELVEDALRGHMALTDATQTPRAFRLVTVKGQLVNPQRDLDRTSELLAEDDEALYQELR